MKTCCLSRPVLTITAALACALAGSAWAAPFATTYTGVIADQSAGAVLDNVIIGQRYRVTFVFDNGGSTALNQTWAGPDLRCTIWHMNDAGNVVFAQNLTAPAPLAPMPLSGDAVGSATTNAAGTLTGMFSSIYVNAAGVGTYTVTGTTLVPAVGWYANNANGVFVDNAFKGFFDAAGGVRMNATFWSAPRPFTEACDTTAAPYDPPAPPLSPTSVPTLGGWMLALLAVSAAVLGALRARRIGGA